MEVCLHIVLNAIVVRCFVWATTWLALPCTARGTIRATHLLSKKMLKQVYQLQDLSNLGYTSRKNIDLKTIKSDM